MNTERIKELFKLSQTVDGRLELLLGDNLLFLCSFIKETIAYQLDENSTLQALLAIRTIRNAFAGEVDAVEVVVNSMLIVSMNNFCRCLVLPSLNDSSTVSVDESAGKWNSQLKSIITSYCQLLANMTTRGNFRAISYLWSPAIGEAGLMDVLAAVICANNSNAMGAFIAFVYNSIQGESPENIDSMNKFCTWRSLSCQLFLWFYNTRTAVVNTRNGHSDVTPSISLTANVAEEWMHMLVNYLVRRGRAVQWLSTIGPRSTNARVWTSTTTSAHSATTIDNVVELSSSSTDLKENVCQQEALSMLTISNGLTVEQVHCTNNKYCSCVIVRVMQ